MAWKGKLLSGYLHEYLNDLKAFHLIDIFYKLDNLMRSETLSIEDDSKYYSSLTRAKVYLIPSEIGKTLL